jgi:hypothetical protein
MPRLPISMRRELAALFDEQLQEVEATPAGAEGAEGGVERLVAGVLRVFEKACRARGLDAAVTMVADAFGGGPLGSGPLPERLARALRPGHSNAHVPGETPAFRPDADGDWILKRFESVAGIVWGEAARAHTATPASESRGAAPAPRPGALVAAPAPPDARPYDPSAHYDLDEWLVHPIFGAGRVVKVEPGRVRVQFARDQRVLAAGRGLPDAS